MPPLQVLLDASAPPLVAGVPTSLRTAHLLAGDGTRIFLCTRAPSFARDWKGPLAQLRWREVAAYNGARPLREQLEPDRPVLLVSSAGLPEAGHLARFVEQAAAGREPAAWIWRGAPVAAYYPDPAPLLAALPRDSRECPAPSAAAGARRIPADGGAWRPVATAEDVRDAEESLFRALPQDSDGYLARLDRRLSIALSRRLLRTPVTPNHITAASLLIGLAGSALLVHPAYALQILGAFLLWTCCVLDGCDGEIARLKLLSSPLGARFDVIADNIVHLAIFAAIPLHLRALHPETSFLAPGVALMAGVILSMLTVWRLILRQPEDRRAAAERVYERIASRDFIYLVAFLTLIQRLEWFLWSAAVGAHLFWLSLCWVSLRKPAK